MTLRLKSLQMLGSEAPFSNWASHPLERQKRRPPFTSAMRRLACSTSRTVMLRPLRSVFSLWPAGTVLLHHPLYLSKEVRCTVFRELIGGVCTDLSCG